MLSEPDEDDCKRTLPACTVASWLIWMSMKMNSSASSARKNAAQASMQTPRTAGVMSAGQIELRKTNEGI